MSKNIPFGMPYNFTQWQKQLVASYPEQAARYFAAKELNVTIVHDEYLFESQEQLQKFESRVKEMLVNEQDAHTLVRKLLLESESNDTGACSSEKDAKE